MKILRAMVLAGVLSTSATQAASLVSCERFIGIYECTDGLQFEISADAENEIAYKNLRVVDNGWKGGRGYMGPGPGTEVGDHSCGLLMVTFTQDFNLGQSGINLGNGFSRTVLTRTGKYSYTRTDFDWITKINPLPTDVHSQNCTKTQ